MTEPMTLYKKYHITKNSGQPADPDAQYFVLRLDTDPAARKALRAYAAQMKVQGELIFHKQLLDWLGTIEAKINEQD